MAGQKDGWIEACTVARIAGWAVEDGRPAELHVFVGAACVAKLRCDRSRPDLPKYDALEECGFAWWFDAQLAATDTVSVRFEDGTELNGSPLQPSRFDGHLDVCTPVRVSGWAIEDDHAAELDVFADGQLIGNIRCEIPRPGLAELGLPLASGFSVWLPRMLLPTQAVSVRFRDGSELANSPCSPSARDGQVEHLTQHSAVGWVLDAEQPAMVQLYLGEAHVSDVRCDLARPDLAERGVPLSCGFDVPLPQPMAALDQVSIRFPGDGWLEILRVTAPDVAGSTPDLVAPILGQRPTSLRVLMRRRVSLGDVIMTTPVLARLRYMLGAEAVLDVETRVPTVFYRNPHVNHVIEAADSDKYDRVIDLDLAYERQPRMHVIDAYMLEAFLDPVWPAKDCLLYRAPIDDLPELRWSSAVALHPARTWRNRTMSQVFWRGVIDGLIAYGWIPVVLGSVADFDWAGTPQVIDLTARLSIHQVATVIERCACFVGNDSGLLHVAGTTSTPIVGLFTVARPEYRLPWRAGVNGWRTTALVPALDCVGCLADAPAPVISVGCHRGDYACVGTEALTPALVVAAIAGWMDLA
jgi:ADP-heptose:LPS heptosyltransferase